MSNAASPLNIFLFRRQLVDDYAGYTRGFIHVREQRLREFINRQLDEGVLWPEPLIQLNPAFEPGESIDELVARGDFTRNAAASSAANSAPTRWAIHSASTGTSRRLSV